MIFELYITYNIEEVSCILLTRVEHRRGRAGVDRAHLERNRKPGHDYHRILYDSLQHHFSLLVDILVSARSIRPYSLDSSLLIPMPMPMPIDTQRTTHNAQRTRFSCQKLTAFALSFSPDMGTQLITNNKRHTHTHTRTVTQSHSQTSEHLAR